MSDGHPYKRILLKISGQSLTINGNTQGLNQDSCDLMAQGIKQISDENIEVAIVIGGGNILRGADLNMPQSPADHMGMLATLINGIALQQALKKIGCNARVMSALECPKVADTYNWQKAHNLLERKEILIFVGGTGNPYFTTDSAAALRASEINADALLKATKVNGIYNKDPLKYDDAIKYDTIPYTQALTENLKVMDATAFALCMTNNIPIIVFHMDKLIHGDYSAIFTDNKSRTLVQ